MPPCAAIECARRGESWKQKHETAYPSSASDAAADAPASPEPTTMTWCLTLFAGLTSRISARWRSHLSASAPAGTWAPAPWSPQPAGEHRQRNRDVTRDGRRGQDAGRAAAPAVGGRPMQAQRLQGAPHAVVDVQPDDEHGGDIERRDRPQPEACDDVVVDVARDESRIQPAEREIQQVVDYVQRSEERRVGKECRSRWWPYD